MDLATLTYQDKNGPNAKTALTSHAHAVQHKFTTWLPSTYEHAQY